MSDAAPHFAFPFRFTVGGFVTVPEDSIDEISQCVEVIVRCPQGERIENLEFGVPDMTFSDDPVADRLELVSNAARWEPRAEILVDEAPDVLDEFIRHVSVRVKASGGSV